MKENIVAIISFIGGLGWGLFGVIIIMTEKIHKLDEIFLMFALLSSSISTILYVVWTKFGKKEFSELDKIDFENQLLKRQIEQKQLRQELEG